MVAHAMSEADILSQASTELVYTWPTSARPGLCNHINAVNVLYIYSVLGNIVSMLPVLL